MKDALRVTVMAKYGAKVSLRIEETLHGSSAFAPGEVIEGTRYDDTLACFAGCTEIVVGQQAFAFFMAPLQPPAPLCPEREACLAKCEAENPDEPGLPTSFACACRPVPVDNAPGSPTCGTPFGNADCQGQCSHETRGRCPPPPEPDPKRLHVALSPWSDPIVFVRGKRGELSVPLAQLEELFQLSDADQVECVDRFGQWSDYVESAGF
jgi:hypothetical protein